MKKIKTTSKYIYVQLGDRDIDEVWANSDLVRVEKDTLKYKTLSDAIKCDNEYEEIEYPDEWVKKLSGYIIDKFGFDLPTNIDEIIASDPERYLPF